MPRGSPGDPTSERALELQRLDQHNVASPFSCTLDDDILGKWTTQASSAGLSGIFLHVTHTQAISPEDKKALLNEWLEASGKSRNKTFFKLDYIRQHDPAFGSAWRCVRTILFFALLVLDESAFHIDLPIEADVHLAMCYLQFFRWIHPARVWGDIRLIIECRLFGYCPPQGLQTSIGKLVLQLLEWPSNTGYWSPALRLRATPHFPSGSSAEIAGHILPPTMLDIDQDHVARGFFARLQTAAVALNLTELPRRTASQPPPPVTRRRTQREAAHDPARVERLAG